MLGELNNHEIRNVLSSHVVGRLGYINGKQPYIVPVTYVYDGENIYGQSNEGTKLDMLRKNPNICFEVDVMTDMANWQSVIVLGKFEELHDKAAKHAREILFGRVFTLMTSSTIHAHEHAVESEPDDSSRVKHIMYRICITKMTGRFEKK